ncbi:ABC transporter ATP-binding protein [Actinopolymorpha alba]|uniref:ABC transporter ATP-binding protein n=1 Tax=Actinopolymorpha alba TaxID=533267 RepID=UPI000371F6B1|nr:ABC transporter ATP-binding protein [Actinopolymorpha alba]
MLSWHGYGRFVRVAVRASRTLSAVTVVAVALAAVAPLGAVAAIGAVVGEIPELLKEGFTSPAGTRAMWWAVAAGGFFLLQWSAGSFQSAAASALGERIDAVLQRDLMAAAMRPDGIAHLEDPRTLDLLTVGRDTFRAGARRPGRLATTLSGLLAGRVVLVGSCLIVAGFHPLLGAALLVAALWTAYEDKVVSRIEANHHNSGTEAARRTEYYYELGVTPPAAKEIRVFGLSRFLLDRFAASWRQSMDSVLAPSARRPLVAAVILGAVVLLGIGWIAREAVAGRIGAGPAAVYAQALMVSLGGMRQASWTGLQTELALATLNRYHEAVTSVTDAATTARKGEVSADGLPRKEIRFERVAFSYPGGTANAVHDLDLVIPAGRSLAIVGANGAGKTTLIKLLSRMYEPTAGRLTVDDVDLSELDLAGWRRRLAAVFQDSTRFAVPARTSVGFGRVDAAADHAGIEAVAASAGVADAIAGLPGGWDTPLSSEYAGGADLSGGEWQKVGLARALFAIHHGASVLILDEPAAHLDARAEAHLYERFLDLTKGVTTIVISHRFSTVRQADSIAVLDAGRVVEQGSHDELLARDGAYAEMFRLQASRFSGADEPHHTEVTQS